MQLATSSVLEPMKKIVYSLPVIYDNVLELKYPPGIPMMRSVYGVPPTNIRIVGANTKQCLHDVTPRSSTVSVDFGTDDMTAISAQILKKQEVLLAKLKALHADVDSVEKSLRKEKSTVKIAADSKPESAPSSVNFVEKLQKSSGDLESIKTLIVTEQQSVLARLRDLHLKLDSLEQRSCLGKRPNCRTTRRTGEKTEKLIVSANPRRPPLALIAAANHLAQHGLVHTSTFVHSSAQTVPENLRVLLNRWSTTDSRTEADFVVSLIWTNGEDTTLIVDASRQNPILAEANIIRYVLRILNPNYDTEDNLQQFAVNDKWLNLASRVLGCGNTKERQSAIRHLNGHLGKSTFLTGAHVSLVDAVVFSGIFNAKEYASLTGNVKTWAQACLQTDLFYGIRECL